MATSTELLRGVGLAATRQRIALIDALRKLQKPSSAEAVAKRVVDDMNLTTVYRGLDQLQDARLVRRIDLGKNHALYELAGSHHHHVVCRGCGKIQDVDVCLPPSVTKQILKESRGFVSIDDHALEFFGTCTICAKT